MFHTFLLYLYAYSEILYLFTHTYQPTFSYFSQHFHSSPLKFFDNALADYKVLIEELVQPED